MGFILDQNWTNEVPRLAGGFSPAGRNDVSTVSLGGGRFLLASRLPTIIKSHSLVEMFSPLLARQ